VGVSVYDDRVSGVTAFILAGGKSTRMGADKAFLELEGTTLLSRALKLGAAVAAEVRIVGDAKKFSAFAQVVEDVFSERGPLAGIHAALLSTTREWNLMLAADLPFLEAPLLDYIIAEAKASGTMVTVPRVGGRLQPLCAVYGRAFGTTAERALKLGKNKIDPLFAEVKTRIIEERELKAAGFPAEMFGNVNTPEEWEQARLSLGRQPVARFNN
jgi:molybdopterin-guanine dinucleotide biosynthesis protein A